MNKHQANSRSATSSEPSSQPDFRVLFESAPGLYLVLTPDFRIVAVSDAYLRATMTKREEILGRGIFDVFPDNPNDPTATGVRNLTDSLERVVKRGVSDTMAVQKYDIRRPEGGGFEVRYWSPVNSPVFGGHGEVTFIIHRVEDVTEYVLLRSRGQAMETEISLREEEIDQRKRVEEELRAAEERMRSIVDHVIDGIITIDERGTIESCNPAAERIFGYSASEIHGQNVKVLMPPPYHGEHDGYLANYLRSGEAKIIGIGREVVGLRKDGSTFPMELAVSTFYLGRSRRFTGMVRDISERKQAEAALQKNEERFQELTTHIRNVLWMIDTRESKILYVSPAYETIWGRSCQSLLDNPQSYMEGIHPLDLEMMTRENAAMLKTGYIDAECRVLRPDETVRWVWIRGYPVMDQGQIVRLVGVIEDITERKSLESQFQQAQKMEVVGHLAGGVAHDFNNLLAVILGCCQFLEQDETLIGDGRDLVEDIYKAASRAATLTKQLLAFSRQQILHPKVLNLNEVVTEAVTMLDRLIGEDIKVTTNLNAGLWPVKVDAGQMTQVIMNLALNARDAMPEGGKLTIETANGELDESYAQAHQDVKPGLYVVLSISDTGCGMDEKTKARMFEPFFTTKDTGKGTGLGLATVFGIVKQSAGHINAYSEPGKGTTFKVYLPIDVTSAAANTNKKPQTLLPRGTETVMIVEDEEMMRNLTCRILESQGYTVLQAANGKEALQSYDRHQGQIHLVLTDVVMPELGGRQLYDRLRAAQHDLKVLFMSGYTDDAVIRHGVLEAETDFIEKPFTYAALANKVRAVLDRRG